MASYKDTLLEFPCDFPLKIMGKAEDELAQVVLEIVTRHAPGFDGASMEMRASSGGNYLSLTCTVSRHFEAAARRALHRPEFAPAGQSGAVNLHVRQLGRVDYEPTWQAMQEFTAARTPETPDELWIVEHPPVFTQGQAGKPEHMLSEVGIPSSRSTAAARSPTTAPARS
jgi:putative lipoic acid-binding regulatory protein